MNLRTSTRAALITGFCAACATTTSVHHLVRAWSADVTPVHVDGPGGFATVSELEVGETRVVLTVVGAVSGQVLMWRVRTGTCAELGEPLGDDERYVRLAASQNGNASGSATLPLGLQADIEYVIAVRSGGAMIACGALRLIET